MGKILNWLEDHIFPNCGRVDIDMSLCPIKRPPPIPYTEVEREETTTNLSDEIEKLKEQNNILLWMVRFYQRQGG